MEHREISLGSKNLAELQANQVSAWNAASKNADPNDPTVAAKFNAETLEPALEQFSGSFMTEGGQRFAQESANRFRQHMFEKTAADMSSMAADAVHMNVVKTMNASGNMVYNDPSSLDFARDNLRASVSSMADSSPNLTPAQAAKVKNDLAMEGETHMVRAAIMGAIAKGGDWKHIADDPKNAPYVNEAEIEKFARDAKMQARNEDNIRKQGFLLQKQMDDQAVHVQSNKTFSDNVKFDPTTGHPTINPNYFQEMIDLPRKFPNAPNAAQTAKTGLDWGESQQNKEAKPADDPLAKSDLMTRMFSPDNPTTTLDLMKAHAAGLITDHTFQAYHGLVQELEQSPLKGPVWQDTIAAVKAELVLSNVGLPGKDIIGEGSYAKWAQTFIPQYLAKSRAGNLPANALDVKDPTSLISQSMGQFRRSVQQRAQDYLSVLGGGNPAAAPTPTTTVTTKAQFDALPSGTTYTGADGKPYRKP